MTATFLVVQRSANAQVRQEADAKEEQRKEAVKQRKLAEIASNLSAERRKDAEKNKTRYPNPVEQASRLLHGSGYRV